MSKEEKMFDEIKDLVPDNILNLKEFTRSKSSVPSEEWTKFRYGFRLLPSESQLTREQAIDLYNKIRGRLPDIVTASFREERDMEWEFELEFFRADNREQQDKESAE